MRPTALRLVIALVLLASVACSVDDGSQRRGRPTSTDAEVDTAPTEPAPTTTWPASVGVVKVAEASYDITATCYAPGAGEVLAIGSAMTPDGDRVELYLQAFLGAPYVGISVYGAQTITYEAAIDRPLTITYEADILRADDIDLVTDLDLASGDSIAAGTGSVVIECRSYESELPPGFVGG